MVTTLDLAFPIFPFSTNSPISQRTSQEPEISPGEIKRRRAYKEFLDQGYEFRMNDREEYRDKTIGFFSKQGLEVISVQEAYDCHGKYLPKHIAILTRTRKE